MPLCQSSSLISMIWARGPWPALFTSTSMRPQRSSAPSVRRFRSSFDWLEPVTPKPPSSLPSASPLPEEDSTPTLKPSAASRFAAAAPMPLPPAVTRATFSPAMSLSIPAVGGENRPVLKALLLAWTRQGTNRIGLRQRGRNGESGGAHNLPHKGPQGGDWRFAHPTQILKPLISVFDTTAQRPGFTAPARSGTPLPATTAGSYQARRAWSLAL